MSFQDIIFSPTHKNIIFFEIKYMSNYYCKLQITFLNLASNTKNYNFYVQSPTRIKICRALVTRSFLKQGRRWTAAAFPCSPKMVSPLLKSLSLFSEILPFRTCPIYIIESLVRTLLLNLLILVAFNIVTCLIPKLKK